MNEKRSRLAVIASSVTAVAVIALAPAAQANHPPEDGASKTPRVSMERLLLAGQLDQFRQGNGHTAGAKDDVKRVQRALRRKGYDITVDGSWGAETADRYSNWQHRSTGASGYGANGLVGESSLKKLGKGHFKVNHIVKTGKHVVYSGEVISIRTRKMLKAAGHQLGKDCVLDVTKGSYVGSDGSSAATHAAGGAVDLADGSRCGHTKKQVVHAMRTVGFAAWHRVKEQGFDADHFHAIAISDPDMSTPESNPGEFTSMHQVADYAKRESGLHYPTGAKLTRPIHTWEQFKRAH